MKEVFLYVLLNVPHNLQYFVSILAVISSCADSQIPRYMFNLIWVYYFEYTERTSNMCTRDSSQSSRHRAISVAILKLSCSGSRTKGESVSWCTANTFSNWNRFNRQSTTCIKTTSWQIRSSSTSARLDASSRLKTSCSVRSNGFADILCFWSDCAKWRLRCDGRLYKHNYSYRHN